jgi:teichuronic acid biosynthesis glycosyltransferase TuaC
MAREIKRVLWISDYFPRPHDLTSGVWALESAVHIQNAGVEVVVLAPTPWIPPWLAVTNKLRPWCSVPPEADLKGIHVYYPKCLHYPDRRVVRWLYNPAPVFESHVVWRGCRETVRRIMDRREFQAVHANFIFPSGFIGMQIKKRYGVPLVIHERSRQRLEAARDHRARGRMYRAIIKKADAVITPNRVMSGLIREMTGGLPEVEVVRDAADATNREGVQSIGPRVDVLRSAGDTSVRALYRGRKPDRYAGKKVILSVGSMIERKGQEILIRAMAMIRNEFPEARCLIIGDGEKRARLEQITRQLSLTNIVEIPGKRPHSEVLDAMSWCDVFVLPSWNEPFGTVYAEAMSFGKPVVACSGQGVGELIEDGVSGLLVPPRNPESLAKALRLLMGNPDRADEIGRAGRVLADGELNYTAIAGKLIQLYRGIQPDSRPAGVKGFR